MNAKEQQLEWIRTHLKPMLKASGFKVNGQTWFKHLGEIIVAINLQNFSWNSRDRVDFCFNIGVAFSSREGEKKSVKYSEIIIPLREASFLPNDRLEHSHHNNVGYTISSGGSYEDLVREMEIDFAQHIIPSLTSMATIEDWSLFYDGFPIWKDYFRSRVETLRRVE